MKCPIVIDSHGHIYKVRPMNDFWLVGTSFIYNNQVELDPFTIRFDQLITRNDYEEVQHQK